MRQERTTMSLKSLEISLYNHLNHFLAKKSFILLPDYKQFRKETDTGFQNLILSSSRYADELWIEVNIGVRVNMVEDFAQQFLDIPIEYRQHANTLITSFGRLSDTKYLRYKIVNQEDVEICFEAIKDFMHDRGLEFLDYASHIKNLDTIFNEKPHKPNKYLYNQTHRCFKGIIIAKITDNPQFLTLLDQYQSALERMQTSDREMENYMKLVNFLLYLSLN
jgi:hypothetical protein